ncbi:MAG: Gfo/Idh/MocA family oxidoreductase [Synergistaceae bacterium]|jgi:predicted dehydrogenase|nr:Gfo/Idh/MocA family oxidoreductase [Synergistaceae bacterium]
MSRLKVAVVGAGIYGINHIRAYKHNERAELTSVCELDPKIRERIGAEYGVRTYALVEDMLKNEELDAVSIATPDGFHAAPAILAIMSGKNVLIEKPLATTLADARSIISAAVKYGVRVAVDYHKRWDPAAIQIRNALREPASGRPVRGYMNMDDIIDVPSKWFTWSGNSSPVHFLGTHCYDQIRWFMGCEVTEVFAVGTKQLLKSMGIDTYDTVQAFLLMENGCWWTVETGWIYPSGFSKNNDGRTQILCENALFRSDSQNRGVEIYDGVKCHTPNSYFMQESKAGPFGFGIEPINDFVRCLLSGEPFIADASDGLEAEKIAEAVHKSLETGAKVKIERES